VFIVRYVENWLPVVGYEGQYEVSNLGRVKSLKRGNPKLLSPFPLHAGHLCVSLYDGNHSPPTFKRAFVHRLVLEAFVGQRPSDEFMCRHLNGNPADNKVENLAWGTALENGQDMARHGTSWQKRKSACPSGHSYDEGNTIWYRSRRYCRTCRDIRNRTRSSVKQSA
jgi:hypothetical protein